MDYSLHTTWDLLRFYPVLAYLKSTRANKKNYTKHDVTYFKSCSRNDFANAHLKVVQSVTNMRPVTFTTFLIYLYSSCDTHTRPVRLIHVL